MIKLKTPKEIEKIRRAGNLVARCLELAGKMVEPGLPTIEIDRAIEALIRSSGGKPVFKGYGPRDNPFPSSTCISIDEEVVHGIPSARKLETGMIVGVDVGVELDGYIGDAARTFAVGEISDLKKRLMQATEESLAIAIDQIVPDVSHLSDIGYTVQTHVEARGFSVVRDLCGHGVGQKMHEDPQVPNYGQKGRGVILRPGIVIAIEPMINAGTYAVKVLKDGWTVVTADGKPSAHFEHTVAITEQGPQRLTILE
ncbi:MAG: type I methionyl aminopeptidase [bacterium]|nr:type I methionyl aminopeptidase [bacterium]